MVRVLACADCRIAREKNRVGRVLLDPPTIAGLKDPAYDNDSCAGIPAAEAA
jgi:hypothetical protein